MNELENLSDKELRVKVAEALGITEIQEVDPGTCPIEEIGSWIGKRGSLPVDVEDFPCDLNACAEFEAVLLKDGIRADFSDKWNLYEKNLNRVVSGHDVAPLYRLIRATARQRCIAFLLTMEK